jgi:hypothetical protein
MPNAITRRIERELGYPGLTDALVANLSASDLQSLLIEVYRARAERAKDAGILTSAAANHLVQPSTASTRDLAAFDSVAFGTAQDFEAVELSPVCPFAAEFKLGGTSQNNVLTTIRNAEVLGDPTIALAIEASLRRRKGGVIRLCCSHRAVRLQPFDVPGYSPHFRLFAMITAGKDVGDFRFETAQLLEHTRVYLIMFRNLSSNGFALRSPIVELTDMNATEVALAVAGVNRDEIRESIRAHRLGASEQFLRERGILRSMDASHPFLESTVMAPLREEFPEAQFRVNQARLEGLGYYRNFTLRISAEAPDGRRYPLADGGFTDWTARLLANRKERLLISGVGSEFICKSYCSS